MMVMVALLQMPWFGIKVGLSNLEPPPSVSLWIMPLFLVHLVFWTALVVPCVLSPSLGKMSLSGPTVSTSSLSSLPFWPHCIGHRVVLIWANLAFLISSCCEKAVRPHLRPRRPMVFSGFPVGIGQEIWHGCQFLHCQFRASGHLPGGIVRFIPCQPSAHYARLSHLVWGRYGHGLSSRPRESCDLSLLTPLLASLVILMEQL